MGKIYKDQDYLMIRLHLEYDLSDATSVLIKYKDPDGNEGSWTATIEDATEGRVSRNFVLDSPLGTSGVWTFWAFVTFSDGRTASTEPFAQMVYDEGS